MERDSTPTVQLINIGWQTLITVHYTRLAAFLNTSMKIGQISTIINTNTKIE